jgi:putative transposase
LYCKLRKELGAVFHELARHKESAIEQGLFCPDHVHMLISIPPKFAVSSVIGYIKGKSEKLHRAVPLGERILCQHGWSA